MAAKVRVLIIDDSATMRETISHILSSDSDLEIIGTASDPYEAVPIMKRTAPDVILLDLEMPKMDGLTFLRKLMAQHPLPVVICSAHTTEGARVTFQAFEYGAVDIVTKPRLVSEADFADARITLSDALKAAARARPDRVAARAGMRRKLSADAVLAKGNPNERVASTDRIIVVGASTGGTQALASFLEAIPEDAPGIVIVQHMPEQFTWQFAQNLDTSCTIHVREAKDGDTVCRGTAFIAPGGKHTLLRREGNTYRLEVRDGPLVSRHRPSVDVLFRSAARYAGPNAVGVLMTGMGDDGAKGLLEMRQAGAMTFAQDESTCVVFGMPKSAIDIGAAVKVLPLHLLAAAALRGH